MSRMFASVTRTWSPVTGCLHGCSYCSARKLAETRLKAQGGKYANGFEPQVWEPDFGKTFKLGERIFVGYMGDMFGDWVEHKTIQAVINKAEDNPGTEYLFVTKNPRRYNHFVFPMNCILGTTIESDISWDASFNDAEYKNLYSPDHPPMKVWERISVMRTLAHPRRFVSIEPLMKMASPLDFAEAIVSIKPELVEIGADNYHHNLPEPSAYEVGLLLGQLRVNCVKVNEKKGLERLKGVQ